MTTPVSLSSMPVAKLPVMTAGNGEVPIWRSVVVLLTAGVICLFFWIMPQPTLRNQPGVVMHLPDFIPISSSIDFFGAPAPVTEPEKQILPKDTEFERKNYLDLPGHDEIFCGIVLSGAMQQSIHRPEVCLVAQGWTISDQENVSIRLPSGHILTVRNLTVRHAYPVEGKDVTLTRYNMYWFVGDNVTTSSHLVRIFLSSWDRIFHNRAHRWAYVTVASLITKDLTPDGKDAAQTKAMMVDFIQHIVPTFQKSEMTATTGNPED
jgi:hypothetical protein